MGWCETAYQPQMNADGHRWQEPLLSFAQYVGREMAESRRLERAEGFSGQP
jgi:hypothetical protein